MRVLLAIVFNAVALWATTLVPGITFRGGLMTLLVAGAIIGLFNLIVRPLAMILSLPLLIVTLGLFYFVLNGILLWLASFFLPGYNVAGLMAGILGSLVFTVVNWALHTLFAPSKATPRTDH
jgi:putative membrane protein